MTLKFKLRHLRPVMALGLLSMPWFVLAQTTVPGAETDWRRANEAVGQLKRGHADALKWEQAHMPPAATPGPVADGLKLMSVEDVTRQAWRNHRDLARPLARLGAANVTLLATGRWTDIDPGLQRKVDDLDEVMHVAVQARKAWLQALAARQALAHYQAMLTAADAARELGQRMVNVGNWSALQQARVQLVQSSAQMNLARAQYAATQAHASLIDTLGLTGQVSDVTLPEALPEVPTEILPPDLWQQKAQAIQAQLPESEGRRNQAKLTLALAAYQASHALAQASRETLKTQAFINEETVLRYNGMLSSVWEVLDATRNQSQAAIEATAAQRDFLVAEADLQWALQGGEPDSFVALGGGSEAAAPAAH